MGPSEQLGPAVSDTGSVRSVMDHRGSNRNFLPLATRRVLSGMSLPHLPLTCHRALCVLDGGEREMPWDLDGQERGHQQQSEVWRHGGLGHSGLSSGRKPGWRCPTSGERSVGPHLRVLESLIQIRGGVGGREMVEGWERGRGRKEDQEDKGGQTSGTGDLPAVGGTVRNEEQSRRGRRASS